MSDEYGNDFAGATDLDAALRQSTGRQAVAECVARRLQTSRGALWYDANFGTNLTILVNGTVRTETIAHMVQAEATKDERVEDASAAVTTTADGFSVALTLFDADGPFDLTLNVSELRVELIYDFAG